MSNDQRARPARINASIVMAAVMGGMAPMRAPYRPKIPKGRTPGYRKAEECYPRIPPADGRVKVNVDQSGDGRIS